MSEKFTKRRLATLGITFVMCTVAIVIVTAIGVSSKGVELHALEQEIDQINTENKLLSEKIVRGSSLTSLYDSTAELGFEKPENIMYLNQDTSVAQLLR
jgi:cell division protein FtsL